MRTGLEDLQSRLANPRPFLEALFRDLFRQMLYELQKPLNLNTPPWNPGKPGGGTLPSEWTGDVTFTNQGATGMVYHPRALNDEEWTTILRFLNSGTRPHGPRTAQALHWIENGEHIFRKFVKGVVPSYFGERADRVVSDYLPTIQRKWQRWIEYGELP